MDSTILILIIGCYLLGSVPFGFLIAKLWRIDIRQHGSGNVGATNVWRTINPAAGLLVFTLDLLKGTIPILIAQQFTNNYWLIILAGIAAILGHTYSIFLKFKGGRGSATGLGMLLGLAPDIFVFAFIAVAILTYTTRYVSVASILIPLGVTTTFWLLNRPLPYSLLATAVTIIIIVRHIPNIKRLLSGTERKISFKGKTNEQ